MARHFAALSSFHDRILPTCSRIPDEYWAAVTNTDTRLTDCPSQQSCTQTTGCRSRCGLNCPIGSPHAFFPSDLWRWLSLMRHPQQAMQKRAATLHLLQTHSFPCYSRSKLRSRSPKSTAVIQLLRLVECHPTPEVHKSKHLPGRQLDLPSNATKAMGLRSTVQIQMVPCVSH